MKRQFILTITGLAICSAMTVSFVKAGDSDAQKTFDDNYKNAQKVHSEEQQSKTNESMRDTTHDNRIKVGKDTSIGGQSDPPSVNIRKSTK